MKGIMINIWFLIKLNLLEKVPFSECSIVLVSAQSVIIIGG